MHVSNFSVNKGLVYQADSPELSEYWFCQSRYYPVETNNELRLRFKLKSKRQQKSGFVDQLSLHEEPKEEDDSDELQNLQGFQSTQSPQAVQTANSTQI